MDVSPRRPAPDGAERKPGAGSRLDSVAALPLAERCTGHTSGKESAGSYVPQETKVHHFHRRTRQRAAQVWSKSRVTVLARHGEPRNWDQSARTA
eukprot:scaffold2875_cov247-Pinguiococcus_pyrenoidosus.AAC.13